MARRPIENIALGGGLALLIAAKILADKQIITLPGDTNPNNNTTMPAIKAAFPVNTEMFYKPATDGTAAKPDSQPKP